MTGKFGYHWREELQFLTCSSQTEFDCHLYRYSWRLLDVIFVWRYICLTLYLFDVIFVWRYICLTLCICLYVVSLTVLVTAIYLFYLVILSCSLVHGGAWVAELFSSLHRVYARCVNGEHASHVQNIIEKLVYSVNKMHLKQYCRMTFTYVIIVRRTQISHVFTHFLY